jgi:hypothetical protein
LGRVESGGVDLVCCGWWAGCMAARGVFVGREGELSLLVGALSGDARLVLVVGDAGWARPGSPGRAWPGRRTLGW